MTSFQNIETAAARKSLLNAMMGAGRFGFRKGKTLAAIKADLIARGKVDANDIVALGHVNEGFQTERNESILEAA